MRVTFKRTSDYQQLRALHDLIFPADVNLQKIKSRVAWIGYDETGTAVAFCTARKLAKHQDSVFLERAGVLPIAEGKGLQRRMIRLRERWAKKQGVAYVITYVAAKNYASFINLLKCKYRLYTPSDFWGGKTSHYFYKEVNVCKELTQTSCAS